MRCAIGRVFPAVGINSLVQFESIGELKEERVGNPFPRIWEKLAKGPCLC